METINQQRNRQKSFLLSSLMKNKKTAGILFDAMSAPMGSTKRKKAASVLTATNKAARLPDGQGGPYDALGTFANVYSPSTTSAPTSPRVKQSTTPPTGLTLDISSGDKIKEKEAQPKTVEFLRGLNSNNMSGGSTDLLSGKVNTTLSDSEKDKFLSSITLNKPEERKINVGTYNLNLPDISSATKKADLSKLSPIDKTTGLPTSETLKETSVFDKINPEKDIFKSVLQGNELAKLISEQAEEEGISLDRLRTRVADIRKNAEVKRLAREKAGETSALGATSSPSEEVQEASSAIEESAIYVNPETGSVEVGSATEPGTVMNIETVGQNAVDNYNALASMTPEEQEAWYNSLTPSEQASVTDVKKAVDLNLGPETWKMVAMTNKDILRNMGLPEEFINSLPASGLLSDQLVDLKDTIDAEYQVNQNLEELRKLRNEGLTLEVDAKRYIRGKDEYLKQVDELLDKAKTMGANMDMSNPYTAERMSNYISFLNMMKGRQEQRYTDFLNESIDYYNARYKQSEDAYISSYDNAKEEFEKLGAVTEESYNNISDMLVDSYNSVKDSIEDARDEWRFHQEVVDAEYDNALSELKLVKEISGTSGEDSWKNITNLKLFDELVIGAKEDDNGNFIMSRYNPDEALTVGLSQNYAPEAILSRFQQVAAASLNQYVKSGNYMDEAQKYVDALGERLINIDPNDEEQGVQALQEISSMENYFLSSISDGLKNHLSGKAGYLRTLMEDLTGKGWFNKKAKEEDRQKIIDRYKESLSEEVINSLFDFYIEGLDLKVPLSLSDTDLETEVANKVAGYSTSQLFSPFSQ